MHELKRVYEQVFEEHLLENRQMLFLVGPRQVGKTTTSLEVSETYKHHFYFNWDAQGERAKIVEGPDAIAEMLQLEVLRKSLPVVVFDELHKYGKWKSFLKGFFDKYSKHVHIIVTGSARLDVYRAGGDSLMGRYFCYRLHPLSVAEIVNPKLKTAEISEPKKISEAKFSDLMNFGGFPEPFLKQSSQFYTRWKRTRTQQLFQEDLRDATMIRELGQLQLLAEVLRQQVGQATSYTELAKKVNVSVDTVRRWLEVLKSFYYCYTIQP
ncbi:MAG: AAA family ATPase [Chlamydiales bacterium]|nr:AAA family ATPase [Chlamydiales bacterium]